MFLEFLGQSFPSEDFNADIEKYLEAKPQMQSNIGLRDGKVIFTQIIAKSPVMSWYPSS